MLLRGFGVQISGPVEGVSHTSADILLAHMLVKFSLMHSHLRLFPCPTKNELSPGFVHAVGKILQCLKASGIDCSHVPESQNNDGWEIGKARDYRVDLVSCAKQEGAVDPEDADVIRNFFVLQDMHMPLANVLGRFVIESPSPGLLQGGRGQ